MTRPALSLVDAEPTVPVLGDAMAAQMSARAVSEIATLAHYAPAIAVLAAGPVTLVRGAPRELLEELVAAGIALAVPGRDGEVTYRLRMV